MQRCGQPTTTPGTGWLPDFVTGVLAALACGLCVSGSARAADPAADELKALRDEIVAMIEAAPCANLVHCRALALGVRACGGPAEYLPYSSFVTDRALLEAKAFEYTFLHEDMLRKQQAIGPCVMLPEPRLQCVNRRCRIENAAP